MAIDDITPLPEPPVRGDAEDQFVSKANAFLGALPTFQGQLNTYAGQANTQADAVQANRDATDAARDAALAATNYQGEWSNLSGSLSKPASTLHEGYFWALNADVADVTANEPGVSGVWDQIVAQRGRIVESLPDITSLSPLNTAALVDGQGFRVVSTGRAGDFVWRTGDQSANVSADPQRGLWVAPDSDPTGASGAFERIFYGAVDVSWFGAGETADDTNAFSGAAQNAESGNSQDIQKPNIPFCDWATVLVPGGSYTLTDQVNTGNKEIVWLTSEEAEITGFQFLNGRVLRRGSKINDFHHGTHDQATSFSIMANRSVDEIAQISGFTNPNELSKGNGRDTVASYFGNSLPPVLHTATSATYTSTGATFSPAMDDSQLRRMRRGMIVHTDHSPNYAGHIDSFTSTTITVKDGWFLVDGSDTGVAATPPDGPGLRLNYFRKVFTLNANAFLESNSAGNAANVFEMGLINRKGAPSSQGGTTEPNGMYSVNLGVSDYDGDMSYFTGGKWQTGYMARGGAKFAFNYDGTYETVADELTALLYATNSDGNSFYHVKRDGTVDAGVRSSGVAAPIVHNFHSSGGGNAYDVRLQSAGGSTTVDGQGSFSIIANIIQAGGKTRPTADNSYSLGDASFRWSEVFAATGTINTSDERLKEQWTTDLAPELRAWEKVQFGKYKYKEAVTKKGDKARWHFGVLAQRVKEAFESEGLNPFDYGILCYDEWDDEWESWEDEYDVIPPVYSKEQDEDGNHKVVEPAQRVLRRKAGRKLVKEAGNQYGIRYEEALCLECALLRSKLESLGV